MMKWQYINSIISIGSFSKLCSSSEAAAQHEQTVSLPRAHWMFCKKLSMSCGTEQRKFLPLLNLFHSTGKVQFSLLAVNNPNIYNLKR